MEIIVIDDSKLKIMLTPEDLKSFEIETEDLDYSNTDTKKMFWDILSIAKHETGFDTDGQKVLVQLYPSRGGGCEMYVTKIGLLNSSADESSTDKSMPALQRSPDISAGNRLRGKYHTSRERYGAFRFDSMDIMIRVCRRLSDIGYRNDSSAYISDIGKCYLFLAGVETGSYMPLDEYSFITEYGTPEDAGSLKYYLCEHGKIICEGTAVPTLGAL